MLSRMRLCVWFDPFELTVDLAIAHWLIRALSNKCNIKEERLATIFIFRQILNHVVAFLINLVILETTFLCFAFLFN